MQRIEINVVTGEQTIVELTSGEVTQALAQKAAWDAEQATRQSTPTFEEIIQSQAETINALTARVAALETP